MIRQIIQPMITSGIFNPTNSQIQNTELIETTLLTDV